MIVLRPRAGFAFSPPPHLAAFGFGAAVPAPVGISPDACISARSRLAKSDAAAGSIRSLRASPRGRLGSLMNFTFMRGVPS